MSAGGQDYWRSLEELAETPGFAAIVEREVPRFREVLGAFDRRPGASPSPPTLFATFRQAAQPLGPPRC